MRAWAKTGLLLTAAVIPTMVTAQVTTPADGMPSDSAAASDRQGGPAEIVVTAQRYEQRLQDVPLSITAVTSEELEARNVTSLSELQYSVPGLSLFDYGPGLEYIQIRGISTSLGAPTVGTYLDEMPVGFDTQGSGLDLRLIDLERIEVLRGPQATLYGEGSMGGTIRYITASPDLVQFGGSWEAEFSDTKDGDSNVQANGVLNVPIVTDKLGLRLVAGYELVGGYIDSLATGQNDINDARVATLRAKLLFRPTDRLDITVLGLHQDSDQDNQNFGVNRRTTAALPSFNRDNYDLAQGVIDYDLGAANLIGSIGYLNRDSNVQYDVSSFYVPFLTAPLPFGFGLPVGFINQVPLTSGTAIEAYSAELRLASTGGGPLSWVVGATYRDIETELTSGATTAPGALPFQILSVTQSRSSESYAVYGQLGYRVTPQLSVLAGLRYYEDRKGQVASSTNFGVTSIDNGSGKFTSLNPRFNISYEFSQDSMIYANAAKGFRSGGFNLASAGGGFFPVPPTYEPDEIWTYEVGTKHQLFSGLLFVDVAGYYSEWSDVQSNAFIPGSPIIVVDNSGQVSGWGVDAAATFRPARGLTLSATYGWNNLAFDEATADKAKGDPVDNAVRESYSASIDYRAPRTGELQPFFRADYQHAGPGQITFRNFAAGQIVQRPARDLVNLRAGVAFKDFEVAIFANNVFDEDAPNIIGPFGVLLENLEQRPRVIGVNLRSKF